MIIFLKKKKDNKKKGGDDNSNGIGVSEDEIKMFRSLIDQIKDEKIKRIDSLVERQETDIKSGKK